MQVKLRVQTGSHQGKEIAIKSEKFLIGRSESCQLRPKGESVSRKHCIIVLKDNRVLIQDLKSRNGTFVNDKRLPLDKAKVLKPGDQLSVGKLQFEVVIEQSVQGIKKPKVDGISDVAARTVQAGSTDSRFEPIDVSDWLDEADQINRVKKLSDPDTRQFQLDQIAKSSNTTAEHESEDLSVSDSVEIPGRKRPDKKSKPGKLPQNVRKAMTDNSRDAADNALKRFFSGR